MKHDERAQLGERRPRHLAAQHVVANFELFQLRALFKSSGDSPRQLVLAQEQGTQRREVANPIGYWPADCIPTKVEKYHGRALRKRRRQLPSKSLCTQVEVPEPPTGEHPRWGLHNLRDRPPLEDTLAIKLAMGNIELEQRTRLTLERVQKLVTLGRLDGRIVAVNLAEHVEIDALNHLAREYTLVTRGRRLHRTENASTGIKHVQVGLQIVEHSQVQLDLDDELPASAEVEPTVDHHIAVAAAHLGVPVAAQSVLGPHTDETGRLTEQPL
eukprot:495117-Prymnesium_polylepis.1